MGLFPLPNDVLLITVLLLLVACTVYDCRLMLGLDLTAGLTPVPVSVSAMEKDVAEDAVRATAKQTTKKKKKKKRRKRNVSIPFPPVRAGCKARNVVHLDLVTMTHYMPANILFASAKKSESKTSLATESNEICEPITDRISSGDGVQVSTAVTIDEKYEIEIVPTAAGNSVEALKLAGKMNILPGCYPDGPTAERLALEFPSLTRVDIVRFLVARKGSYELAKEMITKERAWYNKTFPMKRADVEAAFKTQCFFPFGYARNGSPVVYMRGGLYDSNAATPEQYVLAAAHIIEYALEESRRRPENEGGDGTPQVNVTVLIHSAAVPGCKTATGADMNFIKLFTKVLSDNYPERLRTLVIFPFPWYGRAIWGVAKVFVDKRTQDKVQLISNQGSGIPSELLDLVAIDQMPSCVGGSNQTPIIDLFSTLQGS